MFELYLSVDGVWNKWSEWSACSVTCENGTQTRSRICDYPPPVNGGDACPENNMEEQACTEIPCPGKVKYYLAILSKLKLKYWQFNCYPKVIISIRCVTKVSYQSTV